MPDGVSMRVVWIAAGAELPLDSAEWSDSLAVVEAGDIELECNRGSCRCFGAGSVLFLGGGDLRLARNTGEETVLLSVVSRPDPSPDPAGSTRHATPNSPTPS
jgi:quercetin dioxygenase-like cupin family protein